MHANGHEAKRRFHRFIPLRVTLRPFVVLRGERRTQKRRHVFPDVPRRTSRNVLTIFSDAGGGSRRTSSRLKQELVPTVRLDSQPRPKDDEENEGDGP